MRLRIADRVLVALAGLLLLAACAGIVAQLFFDVDLVGLAVRVFTSENPTARYALIGMAVFLLLLGLYCFLVLFRHRKRKDKFILQKNENGELAISLKALENMVQKCVDQHEELTVQHMYLENRKDGLLIRIRGSVAGGISIPLTVEDLQRQIRQYVTACSGVEVKGIRVQIESSGEDAEGAPFAIAAPAARPLLHESQEKQTQAQPEQEPAENRQEAPAAQPEPPKEDPVPVSAPAPVPAPRPAPVVEDDEEDDRPLHQRLFSRQPEPCIIPEPPVEPEAEDDSAEKADAPAAEEPAGMNETGGEASAAEAPEAPEDAASSEEKTEETGDSDPGEEITLEADPDFLDSLKAFDEIVTGNNTESET